MLPKLKIKEERKRLNMKRVYEVLPDAINTNPIDFIELEEEREGIIIYNLYDYKTKEYKGILVRKK